jgi:hypothetical protein
MVVSREDKARLEEWAAAYAAEALSAATFERRDMNTGEQIRDFDLIFADGHAEPLEVTIHADEVIVRTMGRLKRGPRELKADVANLWMVSHSRFQVDPTGANVPYDLRACERDLPGIIERLERAGVTRFFTSDLRWGWANPFKEDAQRLLELGITSGTSVTPNPDNPPGIILSATYGGSVDRGVITAAVEEEASDRGNQKKLAACADARRRHLFVVLTNASPEGGALWALMHVLDGKIGLPPLPVLPEAITTVWAAGLTGGIFVTPPSQWQSFRPSPELRERYAVGELDS